MNRPQMTAPFAEEELRQFQGRGGKTMTFIEDETVMDRLDAGYGFGNWQILVEPVITAPGVVKVRLGVREQGEWTWYEDFGYPNQPDGDVLKEAVSDGIRRCGRYVGIARDLYRKATYEPGGALGPPLSERPVGPVVPARAPSHEATTDGGLIGTASIGDAPADYQLREEPEGMALSFKLMDGAKGFRVVARDQLAEALAIVQAGVIGKRVICYGRMGTASIVKGKATINYNVLELDRIQTPDFTLPGPSEPDTIPLGLDPDTEAELDAAATAA